MAAGPISWDTAPLFFLWDEKTRRQVPICESNELSGRYRTWAAWLTEGRLRAKLVRPFHCGLRKSRDRVRVRVRPTTHTQHAPFVASDLQLQYDLPRERCHRGRDIRLPHRVEGCRLRRHPQGRQAHDASSRRADHLHRAGGQRPTMTWRKHSSPSCTICQRQQQRLILRLSSRCARLSRFYAMSNVTRHLLRERRRTATAMTGWPIKLLSPRP